MAYDFDPSSEHLMVDIDEQTTRCLCGFSVTGDFWTRAKAQEDHHEDAMVARWGFQRLTINDSDGPDL